MRNDVHFAALKAASKVAFGVFFLGGCSGPADSPDDGASDSELASSSGKAASPCHEDAGEAADASDAGAKASCETVLASAFGYAGDRFIIRDPNDPAPPVSEDVKACCEQSLRSMAAGGALGVPHRWACCDAIDNGRGLDDEEIAMACTPWGPPVPPAMKARASAKMGVA